jgi:phosphate starvation-inducible protein PhoH
VCDKEKENLMGKKQDGRKKKQEAWTLADIRPLTDNQDTVFKSDKNLVLSGSAGTGKSFIACFLAAEDMVNKVTDQIIIIRSAVPTRDLGFLPGNDKEKASIYEEPYFDIFSEILCRGDAYEILKKKDVVFFRTSSYTRGITFRDAVIIVDECQNMTLHELDSLITRVGDNCRIIFCGDFKQADLKKNGMHSFLEILKRMTDDFDLIEFTSDDIVRSEFLKRYIQTREHMGL